MAHIKTSFFFLNKAMLNIARNKKMIWQGKLVNKTDLERREIIALTGKSIKISICVKIFKRKHEYTTEKENGRYKKDSMHFLDMEMTISEVKIHWVSLRAD